MIDNSTLAQIASIIAGFGATMFSFRIQRELQMREQGEPDWMPWADWLLVFATLIALIGGVLLVIVRLFSPTVTTTMARASCATSTVMLIGYVPSILLHYRLIFGKNRSGPRTNPEPREKISVIFTTLVGIGIFLAIVLGII